MQFFGLGLLWKQVGPSQQDFGQCTWQYNHLKSVWIAGFKAAKGQLEFILHVIENAHALEAVRVQIGHQYPPDSALSGRPAAGASRNRGAPAARPPPPVVEAKQIARTCLGKILPQNVMLEIC